MAGGRYTATQNSKLKTQSLPILRDLRGLRGS